MNFDEWHNGEFTVSTDRARLQLDAIHRFLSEESYWANNRTREQTETAIGNSLAFGVYHAEKQIGFARVVTDYATFAYLGDVYVLPEYRGRGLSKWLMETIVSHPELQGFRRWVLATRDGGDTWTAAATPILQGSASSGGASIAFRDTLNGILAGGDIAAPEAYADQVAVSSDGGRTWRPGARLPFPGAVYGLAYVPLGDRRTVVVATGPGGVAWSADEGGGWVRLEGLRDYWAVGFADGGTGWLVGTEGRILRVTF